MSAARKVIAAIACLAILGVACSDETTPPAAVPGSLAVSVGSPNGAEGAAVLETPDAGIVDVAGEGVQVFHWRAGGISRIVVLLDQPGTINFRLSIEDLGRPPRLRLVEVADADNRLRPNLASYAVNAQPVTGT